MSTNMSNDVSSYRFAILDSTGSNWHSWQTAVKLELRIKDLWQYFHILNPSSSQPDKYSTEDQQKIEDQKLKVEDALPSKTWKDWWKAQEVGIGTLARYVDPVHLDTLDAHTTCKAVWDDLVTQFAQQDAQGLALITMRLNGLKFPDDGSRDLADFFTEFKGLVADLKRAGRPMSDGDLCMLLGLAMPLSLQSAVQSLREGVNSSRPNHWMTSLTTSLACLKSARESEVTYTAKQAATQPPSTSNLRSSTRRSDTCHVCQHTGHYARDCPTLTPEERARCQEQSRRQKEGRARTTGQNDSNLTALVAQLQAEVAALKGLGKPESSDEHAKVTILCASDPLLVPGEPKDRCDLVLKGGANAIPARYAVLDSGATRHCASERDFFEDYRVLDTPRKVFLGDDRFILAVGEGNYCVWIDGASGAREGLVFTRTLHIPELACTLISIRQLTTETRPPLHAVFRGNTCEIRSLTGTIFTAVANSQAGGLYALSLRPPPRASLRNPVLALAAFSESGSLPKVDPRVAHARFGHPGPNVVPALANGGLVSNFSLTTHSWPSEPCEPCLLSKSHRLPFCSRSSRSVSRLSMVHADVCGPMDVAAIGGYRYFVTFRDDHSWYLRVALIRKKSEVLGCWREYRAWAERSSGERIGCLMSDRGGEIISHEFECFLRDNGIENRVSSPYTPEQNGVAERVNRDMSHFSNACYTYAMLITRGIITCN